MFRFIIYCRLSLFKCHFFISFVCLFVCFVRWLFVCFFAPVYRAFICWFQKHAIVYFCIICKLIKKKSVFFSLWKCLLYGKKVASYSEYLVEVDFLRIYTHINIYCKSISFFLFCGFQIDAVLELIICMSSSLEWHFLFVCVCVCVCKPKRTKKLLCVFLSLWVPLFLPPLCSFFLSFFSCYLCLLTYCIYILFLFFFSVTVIFTSSLDALTMQTHSSFNHVYSFLPSPQLSIATEEFMGNLGTKHKPTLFGGEARLEYKEP